MLQRDPLCGAVGAEGTGVGLLPRVGPQVCLEVGLGGGAVGAEGAGVGFLSRVGPNMPAQVGLHVSGVEAVRATEAFPGNG